MSDLEITADAPSPTGNREHVIPRGPHPLHARDYAGEEPAIVLLHGFPDNQHLSDRLVPLPCPTTRPSSPTAPTGPGVGFPDRLLRAAAAVDGIAVTLARAALAPRPRPRYRPGVRNRLTTRLLTALPTRCSDRVKTRITGEAEVAPPAAPGPDGADPPRRAPAPTNKGADAKGAPV